MHGNNLSPLAQSVQAHMDSLLSHACGYVSREFDIVSGIMQMSEGDAKELTKDL